MDIANTLAEKAYKKVVINNWHGELKSLMRSLGKSTVSGGKDKETRVKQAAKSYLAKSNALAVKIEKEKENFPLVDSGDLALHITLEKFLGLLDKHIDLVSRRIMLGETIPRQEKMFSIFEEYTEWITKGKQRPSVELGKNLAITTDQYGLIVDYYIMEKETDNQTFPSPFRFIIHIMFIFNGVRELARSPSGKSHTRYGLSEKVVFLDCFQQLTTSLRCMMLFQGTHEL